jgi:predicted HicB family RNase H-like nuclease
MPKIITNKDTVQITIRLPKSDMEIVTAKAIESKRSLNQMIIDLIEDALGTKTSSQPK